MKIYTDENFDENTFLHIKSKFYKLHVKLERVMKVKFKCITARWEGIITEDAVQ